MSKKSDATLLLEVKRQLGYCAGFENDENSQARKDALDYYFQRPRGDEVAGRSQVVSGDVSSMVEANLSQMLEAFTGSALVGFGAFGADDEDQAQLEADVCTQMVMGENNGFLELVAAIKDILLVRNGVMKAWIEDYTAIEIEHLTDVAPEALELMKQADEKLKVLEYDGESRAKIRIKHQRRRFLAQAVPLENFIYTKWWTRLDVQDIPCCGEHYISPRSDLIAEGFDKKTVKRLQRTAVKVTADGEARNPYALSSDQQGLDESRDPIEWYRLYVLADRDGDGISERLMVCFSGNELLRVEEVDAVPYAVGTAILNAHRLTGISLYDKLRQVQDISTGLERCLLDNVNTANKNRTAGLDGKVQKDDIDNGRPDGHIRVKSSVVDVRQAIMAFTVPDLSQGILMNLDHQRSRRTEMGGAALELSTGQMQLNDRVGSEGLDRAYSVMEQLASMMTKIAAHSLLRSLFLIAHRTLRTQWDEPIKVKVRGNWLDADPSQWPERLICHVKPGMSPGERARRASVLDSMLEKQLSLAERGMDEVLVNIDGFYKNLMDWARTQDVQNPEQYFVDPMSEQSQQAAKAKAQAAEQMKAAQQKLIDQALQLEQLRVALDKYKGDADRQFDYFNAVLGAEIEEAKLTGKGIVDILKAKIDGKTAGREVASGEPATPRAA